MLEIKTYNLNFLFSIYLVKKTTTIVCLFFRLVLVVIIVFCVCWAPIQFVLFLKAIGHYRIKAGTPEDNPKIVFQVFAHVLAYLNR